MDDIQLQIGLDVILSYKRLSYEPWYALAEFIDNSTQSYRDNKGALDKQYERDSGGLRVTISYSRDSDLLVIRDNAMGMNLRELRKAMHIGKPPKNTSGRSQFGLGLKTAASWFGDLWSVRTSKLGKKHAHKITVDVNKVAKGAHALPYQKLNAESSEHYTEIRIEQLHRQLRGRRLGKTKEVLGSMYRVDIRSNDLVLAWDATPLRWGDEGSEFLIRDDGSPAKQDVDFKIGDRQVRGWVGVLAPGSSGRTKAGFALVRRGRLIRGAPNGWRPELIFGAAPGRNDLINQRVTGELHLDKFAVTHTKDDILWSENEEDAVQERLKADIKDLLSLARSYRTPKAKAEPKRNAIAAAFEDTDLGVRCKQAVEAANVILGRSLSAKAVRATQAGFIVDARKDTAVVDLEYQLFGGILKIVVSSRPGEDAPWILVNSGKSTPKNSGILVLNAAHPAFSVHEGSDALTAAIEHAIADGVLLWAMQTNRLACDSALQLAVKDALLRRLISGEE